MDESEVQRRLASIERRLSLVLALLVSGYLVAAGLLLIGETEAVTPWNAALVAVVGLVVAGSVGVYRRRARQ